MSNCPKCNNKIRTVRKEGKFCTFCENCKVKGELKSNVNDSFQSFMVEIKKTMPKQPAKKTSYNNNYKKKNNYKKNDTGLIQQNGFENYIVSNMQNVQQNAASYLGGSAIQKLVDRNTKYVTENKDLSSLFESNEGIQSLFNAFNESLELAADMPNMGDIIAFGKTCEFIPRVECFRSIATEGNNAPFQWFHIDTIYEKDTVQCKRVNGNFELEFSIIPMERGEVKAIAVYGLERKSGKVVGELFPANRLFKIGTEKSAGYKSYLKKMQEIKEKRSEGIIEIEEETGREYWKEEGPYGPYKKYVDSISSPYVGIHQSKMLSKVAGKTFLSPYVKMRNSCAVLKETDEKADQYFEMTEDTEIVEEITEEEKEQKHFDIASSAIKMSEKLVDNPQTVEEIIEIPEGQVKEKEIKKDEAEIDIKNEDIPF